MCIGDGCAMKKNDLLNSVRTKILFATIIPLVLLSAVCVVTSAASMKSGLQSEMLKQLEAVCVAVRASYDNMNTEPYTLNDEGDLLKGDYNISKNAEEIDSFTEGSDTAVTIFYGDIRKATSLIDSASGERIVGTAADSAVSSTVLQGNSYSSTKLAINGQNYYAYYIPLKDPDGSVVGMVFAGGPSEDIDRYITSKTSAIAVVAIIVTLISGSLIFVIISRIVKAIVGAKNAVNALSTGDLTYEVPLSIQKRRDEVGDMGRSVKQCTEELHKIVTNIQNFSNQVLSSGDMLKSMAGQSNQNATDITSAVEDISKGAISQAQDIETATQNVSDMGEVIQKIVDQINSLNETSSDMRQAGLHASEILNELSLSNDQTVEAVMKVAHNVEATDESVKRISEAVDLISSVASQTNLLSLNASIEAARAGEAGKGFAVVASEIQKLSIESNSSAQTISDIITGLASDSKQSMEMMEEVKQRLKEQQEKMDETKKKFEDVNIGIKATKEGTDTINIAATECDQSRSQVIDIIQNLSAVSEENAASTEETNASMEELSATISILANSSEELKELAVSLADAIKFFKVE